MYASFDFVKRIVPATSTAFITPPPPAFPLAGAAIDLWFANNQYYDSGIIADPTSLLSCSRASIGYAKTSSGTLTQFATNTLRITSLGLLIENSVTNEIWNSQLYTSVWTQDGISPSAPGAVTAPDGTSTGSKLSETAVNNYHRIFNNVGISIIRDVMYTASSYFKAAERTSAIIVLSDTVTSIQTGIDLTNGTLWTPTDSTSGWSNISARVESLADGWYRVQISGQTSNAGTGGVIQILTSNATSGSAFDGYQGDITKGIYLWGVQLEQSSEATSYIPTSAGTAARAADAITNAGDLVTAINSATGSIVTKTNNGESTSFAANVVDSNGTNLLGFDATNHGLTSITATLVTTNTANRITLDKLGIAWDASGRSLVLNAGTIATDATAQTPSATQHLGSNGSANFIYSYIERLTVWTSKLSDATLQGFTSP